mmetsp:Transcript_1494/g.2315  ORF Transcript_1494/g.2315 Transcript_1494/m.2315 type:complete len:129 (+) Transcript_1494:204-590(+)
MVDNAGRLLSPTALTGGVLKSTCCVHPHGTPPGAGQELNLRLRGLNPASRPLSHDMSNFVQKLLLTCGEENLREFTSPAGKDLFAVTEQAVALTEQERKKFHTNVAKLLYLTKRARPDILTAVSFLCT